MPRRELPQWATVSASGSRGEIVPLVGFDGDLVTEEGTWFGGGASSFLVMDPDGVKDSVDRGGRDLE